MIIFHNGHVEPVPKRYHIFCSPINADLKKLKFAEKLKNYNLPKKVRTNLEWSDKKIQKQFWNSETISNKNPTRDFDISTKNVICITLIYIHWYMGSGLKLS